MVTGNNNPQDKNRIALNAVQMAGVKCDTLEEFYSLELPALRKLRINHETLERFLSPNVLDPVIFRGTRQKGYPFPECFVQRVLEMQRSFPARAAAGIQKETYSDDKSDIFLLKNMKFEQIDDLNFKIEDNAAFQVRLANFEQHIAAQDQEIAVLKQQVAAQDRHIAAQHQRILVLENEKEDLVINNISLLEENSIIQQQQ